MVEVVAHDMGHALGAAQVRARLGHHFALGGRAAAAEGIGFDVLVDQFVGVEFRAVAGQKEKPQARGVFLQPFFDLGAAMDGMTVDDEENGLVILPDQAAQKVDEDRRGERALEETESELAAVGEGRDEVAAKASSGAGDDRRAALGAETAAGGVIAAQAHLIAPVNGGPGLARLPGDTRVVLFEPAAHGLRVALESSAHRLLGGEAPIGQQPAHAPDRELQAGALLDEQAHGLAGPEVEGHFELIGRAVDHEATHHGLIFGGQASPDRAPPFARGQGTQPAASAARGPGADRHA